MFLSFTYISFLFLYLVFVYRVVHDLQTNDFNPGQFGMARYEYLPFEFEHKPRGWKIRVSWNDPNYTFEFNGVQFSEMDEAPPRERAALARSAISMQMSGPKKSAKFGLLRRGEYIGVSVLLNTHSKFAKLAVGKYVVTAKQRNNSGDWGFPLIIALNGLDPLTKVWVDYEPLPKNTFVFRINGEDIYSLVKEEIDYDPTKFETLYVNLGIND